MIDEIIKLIDSYWKFDNDQQHLSTWHDKQDLIEAVKKVKNCNAPAVSDQRGLLLALMEFAINQNREPETSTAELIVDAFIKSQQ